ncbi:unnamed protein product [Darwinula stevensoni]|uniref:Uncharacterized protein n=1 Tax=Darwinula stevensoni TaxID=69355 RepID=A0A7R9AF46_9CRUS|nr:unnamed protein product [Darwinula stevensoni]CAG0902564.1 unnamed protein product [Darwinula stevensoni]
MITWQFLLIENDGVRELPEGVFGNVTFEAIIIFHAAVAAVHPSALLPSKDRLYHVQIYFSGLAEFPWEVLPELTHLYYMDLRNNYLTDLPPVLSPSLTTLDLGGNQITRLEYNWSAPNLTVLSFDYSPMSEVQHEFFWGLPNLEQFWCLSCKLGQTILNGTLAFHSPALDLVSLEQSTISSLESHAITGFTVNASIRLSGNQISELTEESIRPMLQVLSSGVGYIDLAENPVECTCSMAWIVLNPGFLGSVKGQCTDGTDFQDLDPEIFQGCI